jgi:hypothetical protein
MNKNKPTKKEKEEVLRAFINYDNLYWYQKLICLSYIGEREVKIFNKIVERIKEGKLLNERNENNKVN